MRARRLIRLINEWDNPISSKSAPAPEAPRVEVHNEIVRWLEAASKSVTRTHHEQYPSNSTQRLVWKRGGKYYAVDKIREISKEGGGCMWCFIDFYGNIYKIAGRKAPAKGVIRGNIASVDPNTVDWNQSWYYK